ncbi:MAG: hypothetical protein HKN12_07160 [Gemmatimonadetes bacterium]|nr:hypothetical protein [Gemmatimonadota bacterium]
MARVADPAERGRVPERGHTPGRVRVADARPMMLRVAGALILGATALLLALAGRAAGQTPAPGDLPAELPADGSAYEVEQVQRSTPKHPTLGFLSENRAFFRARLDDLRTSLRDGWDGSANELDPRWLAWRDMLDDIRAARDTAAVSEEWIRRRALLNSVGELVELELEMDEMEGLLDEQQLRLSQLEEDFVGRQQTSLVVLLKGVPAAGAPRTVILQDPQGRAHRVALTDRVVASLARGGSAELFHQLVEPRDHVWQVSLEADSAGSPTGSPAAGSRTGFEVALSPERNRMTFLEIDVSGWGATPGTSPPTRWWVR